MFTKINKLQKGNKIKVVGNLIKNDKEIVVLVTYLVYVNTNSLSTRGAIRMNPIYPINYPIKRWIIRIKKNGSSDIRG